MSIPVSDIQCSEECIIYRVHVSRYLLLVVLRNTPFAYVT
jgi:hypothetical protein